ALSQLSAPGKAESAGFDRREGPLHDAVDVRSGVDQLEDPPLRPARLVDLLALEHAARHDPVANHGVLGDGGTVAWGQGEGKAGGGPGTHNTVHAVRAVRPTHPPPS